MQRYWAYVDKDSDGKFERIVEKKGGRQLTIYQVRKRKKQARERGWGFKSGKIKPAKPAEEHKSPRDVMHAWMSVALEHEPYIHYQQSRPIPHLGSAKSAWDAASGMTTDCSGSTTICFRAAGLPDPNGNSYNGSGYTGTLRAHLPTKNLSDAKVGDIIVYGGGNGSHVCIVFKAGRDPEMFSHGQESGPKLYSHSVENSSHGGYYTVHNALG